MFKQFFNVVDSIISFYFTNYFTIFVLFNFVFHLFFSFQLFSIFISLTGVMKYANTFCLFLLGISFGRSLLFVSLLHVYFTLRLLN
jgi:hypothetical protein